MPDARDPLSHSARNEAVSWVVQKSLDWAWRLALVPSVIYAVWDGLKGPLGPQYFLGIVVALCAPLTAVAALKSYLAIAALSQHVAPAQLTPTLDMLEAGRREDRARRIELIQSWRQMIHDIHRILREESGNQNARGVTELLETDLRFFSLRGHLSETTRNILWRTGTRTTEPITHSSIHYGLRCVLDEIEELAKAWAIA